jgi:hypothetical protein
MPLHTVRTASAGHGRWWGRGRLGRRAVSPDTRPWQNDADHAYATWMPISGAAVVAASLAVVVLSVVVIWYLFRRLPGILVRASEAGAREQARSIERALDGRLGWLEVAIIGLRAAVELLSSRAGIVLDLPAKRPLQRSRPDPEEQDRGRQTVVPGEPPPRGRMRSHSSITDE